MPSKDEESKTIKSICVAYQAIYCFLVPAKRQQIKENSSGFKDFFKEHIDRDCSGQLVKWDMWQKSDVMRIVSLKLHHIFVYTMLVVLDVMMFQLYIRMILNYDDTFFVVIKLVHV